MRQKEGEGKMSQNHAFIVLEQALDVAETNEPINRASGLIDQADLELEVAADINKALACLREHL